MSSHTIYPPILSDLSVGVCSQCAEYTLRDRNLRWIMLQLLFVYLYIFVFSYFLLFKTFYIQTSLIYLFRFWSLSTLNSSLPPFQCSVSHAHDDHAHKEKTTVLSVVGLCVNVYSLPECWKLCCSCRETQITTWWLFVISEQWWHMVCLSLQLWWASIRCQCQFSAPAICSFYTGRKA